MSFFAAVCVHFREACISRRILPSIGVSETYVCGHGVLNQWMLRAVRKRTRTNQWPIISMPVPRGVLYGSPTEYVGIMDYGKLRSQLANAQGCPSW